MGEFLRAARDQLGPDAARALPTLCWFNPSDRFLHLLCDLGAAAGLAAAAGLTQPFFLAVCWLFYLSLHIAGQDFMGFQWDILLLEAGFLAIWWAPLTLLPRPLADGLSPRVGRWLVLWLLFRLMFASGMVKLLSGDPSWRNLTALTVHYETQPLPTWVGWYAHQLPVPIQKFSCAMMFAVELGAPWAVFVPIPALRLGAFAALVSLQLLIAATGNYCFFNLLTMTLCLTLVDDRLWPKRIVKLTSRLVRGRRPGLNSPIWIACPVGGLIALVSALIFTYQMRLGLPWPSPVVSLYRATAPYRIASGYGLFAVMTTTRREIVIEGSRDGKTWLPYEFKWKPGDVTRRPAFVAPHQPRLDWQMWFAALGEARQNPWFLSFCVKLLRGDPSVTQLLASNPFTGNPPRNLRATSYSYRLTHLDGHSRGWWMRAPMSPYLPPISLSP